MLRDPSNKCNGMTLDNDGNLIVCEHVTSSVVRERPDGDARDARDALGRQGAEQPERRDRRARRLDHLHRPDLRAHARLRPRARAGPRLPGRLPAARRTAATSQLLVDDFAQPNGLCFSPDESLLYINDTDRAHIRVFDVGADHQLSNGRVFAEGIGDGDLAKGGLVDGMKLDEHGNVYVTGPERRLGVLARRRAPRRDRACPESVGNVNWGDDDWQTLYIPASTSVYRVRMKVAGNRLGYMS